VNFLTYLIYLYNWEKVVQHHLTIL